MNMYVMYGFLLLVAIREGIEANGNNKVSRMLIVLRDKIDVNGNDRVSRNVDPTQ